MESVEVQQHEFETHGKKTWNGRKYAVIAAIVVGLGATNALQLATSSRQKKRYATHLGLVPLSRDAMVNPQELL